MIFPISLLQHCYLNKINNRNLGTAGLFVGASLLSFVEMFYYFIVRPFNRWREQQNQSKNQSRNQSTELKSEDERSTFYD